MLGVGYFETDALTELGRRQLPSLGEHRRSDVDPDDLRFGVAPREEERGPSGARPEIEHPARSRLDRVERSLERRERIAAAHLIPLRRDPVELPASQPTKQRPQPWPADDLIRREPRELPSQVLQH
jgi:hypothetical protein